MASHQQLNLHSLFYGDTGTTSNYI